MHKLGFYIQNSTVEFLRDALALVRPPVLLYHVEGGRGLLEDIRRTLAPDTFVIGRWAVDIPTQDAWLDGPDPAARGRELADKIIGYDFEFAFQKGANDRRLVDAWMSLNEAPFGPASFSPNDSARKALFERRARAYDQFQVAFYERLQSRGLEAVAFNFATGHYVKPEHYLDYFGETLKRYKYLGFHEYGWPALRPGADVTTGALAYRACMAGIRAKFGEQHQAIITEVGLVRGCRYPADGNIGWLNHQETLSQERYWESLDWYHTELCKDSYVKGACLYQVGHGGGYFDSFRHLGKDNQGGPIRLMDKIAQLACYAPPPAAPAAESLCERVRAIEEILAPVSQLPDDLAAQIARLAQALSAAAQPDITIHTLTQATDLRARVGRLEAAWPAYAARPGVVAADAAAVKQTLVTLRSDLEKVKSAADTAVANAAQVAALRTALTALAADTRALAPVIQKAKELWKTTLDLAARACGTEQPAMQDVRGKLPQHPTLRYPARVAPIKRVVVHHTVSAPDLAPDRIAQSQVNSGKPGLTYHFLVAGNGTIYWTQPLETVTDQTLQPIINAEAVGVALAGNFTNAPPPDEQLAAASQLIAWLLSTLALPIEAIAGRSEFDKTVGSPGAQWLGGAKYRDKLLAALQALSA